MDNSFIPERKRKTNTYPLNLPGVHLSAVQTEAVLQMMADALKGPTYRYPWDKLEGDLDHKGLSGISIVGYGSLVNTASAAQTLRDESLITRQPVIAFGARRLFNYDMPLNTGRYAPPVEPLARAALNTRITGSEHDVVNGILINVTSTDIPAIRRREVGYDLFPITCLRWNELENPPFLAYILSCPDEPREGKCHTSDKISPHREYYSLCRKGACEIDKDFLRLWLATTYLADGITPVAQWEATTFPEVK